MQCVSDSKVQTEPRSLDVFISSCFVHIRKPDADIFRLALDIAQVPVGQIVFVDNTPMFVEIAVGLGIRGILHTDYQSMLREAGWFWIAVRAIRT